MLAPFAAPANSIVMPWPAPQVWPNFRQSHHWRAYSGPVKAQRELAWALALEAKLVPQWSADGSKVRVLIGIYPPDRRRRDQDGMKGACKSILDGVADAIKVDDAHFDLTFLFHEPVPAGRIVVTL
jgi:hypothetical protein